MIQHHTLSVGPLGANCHILHNEPTNELVIVDPGDDAETILEFVEKLGGKVVAIWNTHAHIDHVNANAGVKKETGAPISIHELEADWLGSAEKTLAVWAGVTFHPSSADKTWKDGDEINALGLTWKIRQTPGHSPGMSCIVSEEAGLILGGDLLFSGSIGRMDLPGGSEEEMVASLKGLFSQWGKDTMVVLSGHGPATTIGQERRSNFLLRELGVV